MDGSKSVANVLLNPRHQFGKEVGRDQKGAVTWPGLSRNYNCRAEGPKVCSINKAMGIFHSAIMLPVQKLPPLVSSYPRITL